MWRFLILHTQRFVVLIVLEAAPGFEPGDKGFAHPCLTAWLCRHTNIVNLLYLFNYTIFKNNKKNYTIQSNDSKVNRSSHPQGKPPKRGKPLDTSSIEGLKRLIHGHVLLAFPRVNLCTEHIPFNFFCFNKVAKGMRTNRTSDHFVCNHDFKRFF